jgi:hypothetical protein
MAMAMSASTPPQIQRFLQRSRVVVAAQILLTRQHSNVQRYYDIHIAGLAVADKRLSHKHQKTDTCHIAKGRSINPHRTGSDYYLILCAMIGFSIRPTQSVGALG